MGKVPRVKKHVGTHRSEGAFTAAEVQAARNESMDMDMEVAAPGAQKEAGEKKGGRRKSIAHSVGVSRRASVAAQGRPVVNMAERRKSLASTMMQDATQDGATTLSRGQRKRLAKKVSVQRKKDMGDTMTEKDVLKQEGALADLEALGLSLQAAQSRNAQAAKGRSDARAVKMTKNNRRRIMVAECAQFQAVLGHPSFQANPLATIHQHLENTMKTT
mmetsp:Transcript_23994/g.57057  ORF Transcript_23994/g.57057 Transcript_23994/m.57057 type:complete len:217 (-) Transcript_23994:121-771(-)